MKQEIIDEMNYVDLLSYIEETNRCPGGKRTITKIMNSVFLPSNPKILEIGSNTGFTSIELAKLIEDANIIGIDVNENAVEKSKVILKKEPMYIQKKVDFRVGDASDLDFEDNSFDMIITGGANTFINESDREKAVKEYRRLLKPNGFLSITNLFYDKPIPKDLLDDLEKVLNFRIKPWRRAYWLDLFLSSGMELFSYNEQKMKKRKEVELLDYVDEIIDDAELYKEHDDKFVKQIKSRWYEIMKTFNDNHEYLSFMMIVMRNNTTNEQREFFLEEDVIDPWTIKYEEKIWNEE
ncbi:class I SAM-dependent methyltransferase [Aerococcus viridans]